MVTWRDRWDGFAKRHLEWTLGAALGCLFLGGVVIISRALQDGTPLPYADEQVLYALRQFRGEMYTRLALEITALGSSAVLALISMMVLGFLLYVRRDYHGAIQLATASSIAGICVGVFKNVFERPRPEVIYALVIPQGYSYPSGHSLSSAAVYFTLGLLACRGIASAAKRWVVMGLAVAVSLLIGLTRMYLGVHYPSDVAGGLLLGWAWALLVEAGRTYYAKVHLTGRI